MGCGISFSRFLSVDNKADLNETDLLPFLAADDNNRVVALYMEDVKGRPALLDALREAAASKPVLAIKAGRIASGQAATASHTGTLAGARAAFRAACRQTGIVELEGVQAMLNAVLALTYQLLPPGNRICILANAGGPAALADDALKCNDLQLAHPRPETQTHLRTFLIPGAQVAGPVDLLGGADENDYRRVLDAVLAKPEIDGVLAILIPQALVDAVAVVQAIASAATGQSQSRKPVLACLMGKASLYEAFKAAYVHAQARRAVQNAILLAQSARRLTLDTAEARPWLEAYGILTSLEALSTSTYDAAFFPR